MTKLSEERKQSGKRIHLVCSKNMPIKQFAVKRSLCLKKKKRKDALKVLLVSLKVCVCVSSFFQTLERSTQQGSLYL